MGPWLSASGPMDSTFPPHQGPCKLDLVPTDGLWVMQERFGSLPAVIPYKTRVTGRMVRRQLGWPMES